MAFLQSPRAMTAVLATLAALGTMAGVATAAPSDDASQKIYLDPQTGDVLDQPPVTAKPDQPGSKTQSGSPYTAWKSANGHRMLSVDPSAEAVDKVVRCPDGSLHVGQSADDRPAGDSASLCQNADHESAHKSN